MMLFDIDVSRTSEFRFTSSTDAVSFFCAKILRPLSEGLLSSTSNKYGNAANLVAGSIDVSQFAVEMGKKSMVDLFHSPNVADGINKVFTYYADQNIGSGGVGSRFGAGARRRENLAAMRWNLHGFLRYRWFRRVKIANSNKEKNYRQQ